MDRTWKSGAAAAPFVAGTRETGYPTEGDPSADLAPTTPGAEWFQAVTEEIRATIVAGAIAPSATVLTQLRDAIKAIADARIAASAHCGAHPEILAAIQTLTSDVQGRVLRAGDTMTGALRLPALPAAANDDRATTAQWVRALLSTSIPSSIPVGVMLDFGGASAPAGYLLCDGSAVSRTTYADLFAVIGTTFGTGDGSTTFNVPDFRRRVAIGAGGSSSGVIGNTVGDSGGSETETLTTAQMPRHSHGSGSYGAASNGQHTHGSGTYAAIAGGGHAHGSGIYAAASDGAHTHTVQVFDDRGGQPPGGGDITTIGGERVINTGEDGSHTHDVSGSSGTGGSHAHAISGASASGGAHTHDVAGSSAQAGSGQPHDIVQPSIVVTKIIRT